MSGAPPEEHPYAAPAATLEASLPPGSSGPGWFWGIVFALPVLALLGLLAFVVASTPVEKSRMAEFMLLAVALALALYSGALMVNGVLMVRRHGSRLLGSSVVMGGIAALLLAVLPDLIGWMSQPREVPDAFWTWSNAWDAVAMGLGAGLYALFQGLLIRWSLKRRARRAQA